MLREQALAHRDRREYREALACHKATAGLSGRAGESEELMEAWRTCVWAIAGYEYDCGFEWRGASDGAHDEDHQAHRTFIDDYRAQAVELLVRLLGSSDARQRLGLLRDAGRECGRLDDGGGWGSRVRREIIQSVRGLVHD